MGLDADVLQQMADSQHPLGKLDPRFHLCQTSPDDQEVLTQE